MKRLSMCTLTIVTTALAAAGCSQTQHDWAIANADVTLPAMEERAYALRRAGSPPELLGIASGGSQLVLVRVTTSADPYYDYRRWGRAFVIVLDAPVSRGRVPITPENGRFIEQADWAPAREPYVGLEGSITILSVSAREVLADCSVRSMIRRTGDQAYTLRGLHTFRIGRVDPAEMERCGIRIGPVQPLQEESSK